MPNTDVRDKLGRNKGQRDDKESFPNTRAGSPRTTQVKGSVPGADIPSPHLLCHLSVTDFITNSKNSVSPNRRSINICGIDK